MPGASLEDCEKLSEEEILRIGELLTDDDWEVVSLERVGGFEVDLEDVEDAADLPVISINQLTGKRDFKARAVEIGVSIQTLYRWQREDAIDVFDDDEVRRLASNRRNHLWQLAPKFKKKPSV